jgi:hypothetical protein
MVLVPVVYPIQKPLVARLDGDLRIFPGENHQFSLSVSQELETRVLLKKDFGDGIGQTSVSPSLLHLN